MGQWKLDDNSFRADSFMFFGNTGEYPVKAVLDIGDSQASHPMGQPGDTFTEVFDDLQADLGVLKDQSLELTAAKTAGQGIFKTIGAHRVVTFFRKHVFTDKIAGLADIKCQLSTHTFNGWRCLSVDPDYG